MTPGGTGGGMPPRKLAQLIRAWYPLRRTFVDSPP